MKALITLLLLFTSIFLCCTSVAQQPQQLLEDVSWLLGTWENHTPRGILYERWELENPGKLSGRSFKIQDLDTIILETVDILIQDSILYYLPAVRDQNQGKPVVFMSSYVSPSKFVVNAPQHDYPQMISYTRLGEDQLVAEISGPIGDKYRYQSFYMVRKSEKSLKNTEIVNTFFSYFNQHQWAKIAGLYGPGIEFRNPATGMNPVTRTREQITSVYEAMHDQTPDIQDQITAVYPSGEKHVIVEFIAFGTSAEGKSWKLPMVSIFEIEKGLIIKDYTYYDIPGR